MPESTTTESTMTLEEIRARRTAARNALVGQRPTTPTPVIDSGDITIDVESTAVAITLPTGDVVLISHDAWRDAASRLPTPAHREPRHIPAVVTNW